MVHLGLDYLRRRRAEFFGLQGVGRVQDRQRAPEPDRWRDVGTGDQTLATIASQRASWGL